MKGFREIARLLEKEAALRHEEVDQKNSRLGTFIVAHLRGQARGFEEAARRCHKTADENGEPS